MTVTDPEAEPSQSAEAPQSKDANNEIAPPAPTLRERLRTVLLGKAKDPLAPDVFRHISLVAFLAWVGR